MAHEDLKEQIRQVIKTNGSQEITGAVMQSALLAAVDFTEYSRITSGGFYEINLASFTEGRWVGEGTSIIADSMEGYLRLASKLEIKTINSGAGIYLYNSTGSEVRLGNYSLIIKAADASGNYVQLTYAESGQYYIGNADISAIYIHGEIERIKSIEGFFLGVTELDNRVTELDNRVTELDNRVTELDTKVTELDTKVTELDTTVEELYESVKKILFIGSSFGVDTISEVGTICASFGKNIVLGNAYIGAATIATFTQRFNEDAGVTYYKWKYEATEWEQYNGNTNKWSSDVNSNVTDEGETVTANDSVLQQFIFADEAWDYIILQNGAYQSAWEDQSTFWLKDSGGDITTNYIQEYVDICKKNCLFSNPVFGINMTWAFSIYHTVSDAHNPDINGSSGADHWVSYGVTQETRQLKMFENIAKANRDCIVNCEDIKFVIPSGTAVQNLRQNLSIREASVYWNASVEPPTISQANEITNLVGIESTYPFMDNTINWLNKSDVTRDTIHADFTIGRFVIGATLFQKLLSKIYNLDISDSSWRKALSSGGGNYREQLATAVTDDNWAGIINAVKDAISNPYSIVN